MSAAFPATGVPTGSVDLMELLPDGTTVPIGSVGTDQFIGGRGSLTLDDFGARVHNIIATYSGDANFAQTFSSISTCEVVTPAPLAITVADVSRVYGDPNPELTGTIVGIKNQDAITASYATAADRQRRDDEPEAQPTRTVAREPG